MSLKTTFATPTILMSGVPFDDPNTTAPDEATEVYGNLPGWARGVTFYAEFDGGVSPTITVEVWMRDDRTGLWSLARTHVGVPDLEWFEVLGTRNAPIFFRVTAEAGGATGVVIHAMPQVQ